MASKPRVVVAMSGGVDSSVAAALLVEQGWDVVGISLRLAETPAFSGAPTGGCCSIDDFADARAVAAKLGFPHYVLNLAREFERAVVEPYTAEYLAGRTPLPCARCNQVVKFDLLMDRALALDAAFLATGHYARRDGDRLLTAVDRAKDQSYFLFSIPRANLPRVLFPIGELTKPQVRAIARERGLPVADKPDSQELCFVPTGDYAGFLERRAPDRIPGRGDIVDREGRVLGRHDGTHRFTVGQRKGLGLARRTPLYVLQIDAETNRVVAGEESELERDSLRAERVNWLADARDGEEVEVKVRHRNEPSPAKLAALPDGSVEVRFATPKKAIAPGQAAVFYRGDHVLGGGWIAG